MAPPRKKSLQEVLRERRAATPLVSERELREREAARERAELERRAAALVARWREGRTQSTRRGSSPELYRAVHAASPSAYFASRHWARRARAQRAAAATCEVARCEKTEQLCARLVDARAVGAEQPDADLVTLCDSCWARSVKLERELGRLPTRAEPRARPRASPLHT